MERSAVADAPGSLHGFPASLTSFVGRAQATHQIAAKLAECRLVTLTGPGGAGKTRLAGEVARQVAGRFADGVWLAELAAARVDALGVPQLLDRIDDRFALLVDGDRLAQQRQRSLAAAVQWSYELLDAEEQRVFRAVSAFPGPFTLDEQACAAGLASSREVGDPVGDSTPAADRPAQVAGVQLQASAFPPKLRVGEILDMYRSFYRHPADVSELTGALGLAGKHGDYYRSLSGGQRLSVALALIGRLHPDVPPAPGQPGRVEPAGPVRADPDRVQPGHARPVRPADPARHLPRARGAAPPVHHAGPAVPAARRPGHRPAGWAVLFGLLAMRVFRWE